MKKIAFIDLNFHKKTKSSIFFQDILSKHFNLNVYYENEREKYINDKFDKYIFWQVIPDFLDLIKIKNKEIILIPMYDSTPINKLAWERYKCFKIRIVCFCKKLYNFFSNIWFDCIYIQYFMPPLKYEINYSNKNIFFRYRWNITRENVKTIIWGQKVSITIKNNPDPWYRPIELSKEEIKKYNVSFLNKFFDTKDEYIENLANHSIFIAPRKQEWIWMSFLESMNLWQCVIAYNDATMNEYISNWKNWILTDFKEYVSLDDYKNLWNNSKKNYIVGYKKWINDINNVINFIYKENNKRPKTISILDYIIDFLIKIRRFFLKLKILKKITIKSNIFN